MSRGLRIAWMVAGIVFVLVAGLVVVLSLEDAAPVPSPSATQTSSAAATPAPLPVDPPARFPAGTAPSKPPAPSRVLLPPAPEESAAIRKLRVVVVDENKDAVPAATVRAWKDTGEPIAEPPQISKATTRDDGTVDVIRQSQLRHRISVSKLGFQSVHVWAGDVPEIHVVLRRGTPLRGRVVYADSRAPAGGIEVRAFVEGIWHEIDALRITDADGRFELSGVPEDLPVRVFARRLGFRTVDAMVVPAERTAEIELVLGDGGVLEGTVLDHDGTPQPGLPVFLVSSLERLPDPARALDETSNPFQALLDFVFPANPTDAQGGYLFRGVRLPADGVSQPRFVFARRADGMTAMSEPAAFTHHGERMQRDVRFARRPKLTVRLEPPGPTPPGLRAFAGDEAGGVWLTHELAPGEAAWTFDRVTPGRWNAGVTSGQEDSIGWMTGKNDVTLAPEQDAEVVVAPPGVRELRGTVTRAGGSGVAGASVHFQTYPEDGQPWISAWTRTSEQGDFVIPGLTDTPGVVRVPPLHPETGAIAMVVVEDVVPGGELLRIVLKEQGGVIARLVPRPAGDVHLRVEAGAESIETTSWYSGDGTLQASSAFSGRADFLWILAEGFAPRVIPDVDIPAGARLDLGEIRLDAGSSLDAVLLDADGEPYPGATAWATDPWLWRAAKIDPKCRLSLSHLPPRQLVHLVVRSPDHARDWRFAVAPESSPATLRLGRWTPVVVAVLDGAGERARGLDVTFDPPRWDGWMSYGHPNENGWYGAELQPGRWTARASREGKWVTEPVEFEVTEKPGAPVFLRIE